MKTALKTILFALFVCLFLASCSEKEDFRVTAYCYSQQATATLWHGKEKDTYSLSGEDREIKQVFTLKEGETLRIRVECTNCFPDPMATIGANVWKGAGDDAPQIFDANKREYITSPVDFAYTFIP